MTTKIKTNPADSISNVIENDCANFACLLDLLADHQDIQEHKTLMGAVSAIKNQFVTLWDQLEAEVEKIDQERAA